MELIGDPVTVLSLFGVGLLFGLTQTMLGFGGGVVMVPLLPMVVAISTRETIATSLVTMTPIALFNAIRSFRNGTMAPSRSASLAAGSVFGAAFAARATGWVSDAVLQLSFGTAVLMMGLQSVLFRPKSKFEARRIFDPVVGLGAGLVSGFTGLSGGVVMMPYLLRLKSLAVPRAVPTSIGALALTSLSGALTFAWEDWNSPGTSSLVRYDCVLWLMAGGFVSSLYGLRWQGRLPERVRIAGVATILIFLGARFILKGWSSYGG
jgi:uncharacterized membrane protein YfcA